MAWDFGHDPVCYKPSEAAALMASTTYLHKTHSENALRLARTSQFHNVI